MSKPQLRAVDSEHLHPRDIARAAIAKWRSDADRQRLPVVNEHDDKGAPLLDRDAVLGHDHHDRRIGRK